MAIVVKQNSEFATSNRDLGINTKKRPFDKHHLFVTLYVVCDEEGGARE